MPRHEIAEARLSRPLFHPPTQPTNSATTPKRTKKPPHAQQESLCARRLREWITRKGGFGDGLAPIYHNATLPIPPISRTAGIFIALNIRAIVLKVMPCPRSNLEI